MTGYYQLLGSIVLIGLGGLFAAIDAAISTVSPARVDELVRDQRPGAGSLRKVMADRPRYVNLVVLLRTSCEITATALLVVFIRYHFSMVWGCILPRASWFWPALSSWEWGHAPLGARTHIPSRWPRPFRCG